MIIRAACGCFIDDNCNCEVPMKTADVCGKEGPSYWTPKPVCVLPKGHKIKVRYTPKLRKRQVVKGHQTDEGRMWPICGSNLEHE